MNKYKLLSMAAASLLLTTYSCSLDEENPSGNTPDNEWTSEAGFSKKINDCYFDMIRAIYGQAEDTYVMTAEGGTDIWQDANPQGSNGNWSKLLRYEDFGSSNGMLNEGYSGFYGTLSACNGAIYYADKVTGMAEADLNALAAEAHFIRAHALYNIVEQWGGKYLPLQPVTTETKTLTSSTVNEFYTAILSDLEFAMNYLPIKQDVYGHVTRAAAYHLYAKACLTYSTYTDGLGNCTALTEAESKELLQKGKTAADYLIDHAAELGVKLYSDVNDVFDEANNKTNEEAVFVVTHSSIKAYNPRGNYYNRVWKHSEAYNNNTSGIYLSGMTPSYATEVKGIATQKLAKGNCYMEPSKYMLDLYGAKDMRYKAFFKDTYYINKATSGTVYQWNEADAKRFGLNTSRVGNSAYDIKIGDTAVYISREKLSQQERDSRRYATYNIDDNYADQTTPLKFFPSLKKADCPSLYQGTNANKPYSSADCIIYRLGETYLIAAEIDWRLGQLSAAKSRLNTLRNRSCDGHDGSLDIAESDITQDFLLDEYAREMIGEWNRWMTLKRFRAFESRLAKCNPQIKSGAFKTEYYLRPIPDAEILLIDNGAEYQNPGY